MKLFNQAWVDNTRGDCERTAVATVLQVCPAALRNYSEVPDDEHWAFAQVKDLAAIGWTPIWTTKEGVRKTESPTGWYVATVPSLTFEGSTHAIVVDQDLRLIHDPNRVNPRSSILPEDIMCLTLFVRDGG